MTLYYIQKPLKPHSELRQLKSLHLRQLSWVRIILSRFHKHNANKSENISLVHMPVCVCMCIRARMYVRECMWIVRASVKFWSCPNVSVCMHECACKCASTQVQVSSSASVFECECLRVCVQVRVCVSVRACAFEWEWVCVSAYACVVWMYT